MWWARHINAIELFSELFHEVIELITIANHFRLW
jgi:hypothetical protein